MAASDVQIEYRKKLGLLGKAGINAAYPNDFEYYMVAFELIDSKGRSVDYFSFPVLPNNIKESQPELNNIKKTAGGIVVIDNDSFIPTEISLSGTFGRKFKFILDTNRLSFGGLSLSKDGGLKATNEFSSFAKTGYGAIKMVENIKRKSRSLDNFGKSHRLIFYNPVLGNNYIVKFVDFSHSQDIESSNMLPNYDISLRSIGVLGSDSTLLDLAINLGSGVVQKAINGAFSRSKRAFA